MRRTPAIRREKLLELLRRQPRHRIKDLISQAETSEATLHRDLDALQDQGHIRKSYGCVEVVQAHPVLLDYQQRLGQAPELKQATGAEAVGHVQSGERLFLDASPTCCHLPCLPRA